ncbi:MAG: HAD hydrolase-like protein [Actinobacteria bacterium]|nr:HAD hydrolase-like protein [Actinomycetota bacterium]
MNEEKLTQIKENFKDVSIAVYGDFALDAYWFLDPGGSEISVETGLLGENVKTQNYYPGGAANIVSNLMHLGPGRVFAVGVIGPDIYGREVLRQMNLLGVNVDYLITDKNFATPVFIKRIIEGREINRIDIGFLNKRSAAVQDKLISLMDRALGKSQAFIFNQQIPNTLKDNSFIEKCTGIFKKNSGRIILVDSRHYTGMFKNAYLKMNEKEAFETAGGGNVKNTLPGEDCFNIDNLKVFAKKIYTRSRRPLFITRGERGILAFDGMDYHVIPGIEISGEKDTVGAGDTITGALTLCLASGTGIKDSSEFANIAASVTIRKLFTTGYATLQEMLDTVKNLNYVYSPELAEDTRRAQFIEGGEVEVCDPDIMLPLKDIKHVIFDNDGTISTLRQGWEEVMEKIMIEAILGSHYDEAELDLIISARKEVARYIDSTTGIQTILQMEGLVELVKRFGVASRKEILDKFGYKKMYLGELMKTVVQRIKKVRARELDTGDFLVAGSIKFLKKLRDSGRKLYLASGTDAEDTLNECGILGYKEYFNGNIYGALDDINKFSKKKLIADIISTNNLKGEELLVIGDGPVEIREGRKAGAITIGVASDEKRRFGLNPKKRERLIKAGAHFLIPDFSQCDKLFRIFFAGDNSGVP